MLKKLTLGAVALMTAASVASADQMVDSVHFLIQVVPVVAGTVPLAVRVKP